MIELAKILSHIISCILGFTIFKLDISVFHKLLLLILIVLEIIIVAFVGYYIGIGGKYSGSCIYQKERLSDIKEKINRINEDIYPYEVVEMHIACVYHENKNKNNIN